MKNIHILPTDKPSRLHSYKGVLNLAADEFVAPTIVKNDLINLNIYITNDEKPKQGEWSLYQNKIHKCIEDVIGDEFKKIILTTDQDLIKEHVQVIDDEFLIWFINNSSCVEVEVKTRYLHYYKTGETFISFSKTPDFSSRNMQCIKIEPRYEIIIPRVDSKQESSEDFGLPKFGTKEFNDLASRLFGGKPKQEKLTYTESAKKEERISNCIMMKRKQKTVEEAVEKIYPHHKGLTTTASNRIMLRRCAWIKGAKWMQERMYSEEDLISFAHFYFREEFNSTMQNSNKSTDEILQDWFDQFKKK